MMITSIAYGDHVRIVLNHDKPFAGTVFLHNSIISVPQDAQALSKDYVQDLV